MSGTSARTGHANSARADDKATVDSTPSARPRSHGTGKSLGHPRERSANNLGSHRRPDRAEPAASQVRLGQLASRLQREPGLVTCRWSATYPSSSEAAVPRECERRRQWPLTDTAGREPGQAPPLACRMFADLHMYSARSARLGELPPPARFLAVADGIGAAGDVGGGYVCAGTATPSRCAPATARRLRVGGRSRPMFS